MTWHKHPGVRTGKELTLGERAADRMRNAMGSWPFIFIFVAAMILWAATNTLLLQRVLHHKPFDPYPYILLNLLLSTLAGLQGGILLIAAKRADAISSEVALHTLQNTSLLTDLVTANNTLTQEIHEIIKPSPTYTVTTSAPKPAPRKRAAKKQAPKTP